MKIPQILIAVLLATLCCGAQAQQRAGKWDISLVVPYADAKRYSFDGGASADVDGDFGLGLALNYGLSDQLSIGGEIGFRDQDYTANAVPANNPAGLPASFTGRLSTRWLKLTGAYHFLKESWHTPYVAGAIGAMHLDSGVPGGPPIGGCYYYPWYGTYCDTGVPTYNDTRLNYSLGLGYRWDLAGRYVARASVDQQWVAGGGYSGTLSWTEYRMQFGFKY